MRCKYNLKATFLKYKLVDCSPCLLSTGWYKNNLVFSIISDGIPVLFFIASKFRNGFSTLYSCINSLDKFKWDVTK